jgi:hypothetical protein
MLGVAPLVCHITYNFFCSSANWKDKTALRTKCTTSHLKVSLNSKRNLTTFFWRNAQKSFCAIHTYQFMASVLVTTFLVFNKPASCCNYFTKWIQLGTSFSISLLITVTSNNTERIKLHMIILISHHYLKTVSFLIFIQTSLIGLILNTAKLHLVSF